MSDKPNDFPSPDDFQDPLENYDPKSFDDPVEQALAEQTVETIQHQPCATISPETTVSAAVEKLSGFQIACLLVEKEGKLVGVFSHRDVLDKVALEYDAVKDRPVSDVMTTNPVFVFDNDPAAAALSVMAMSGHRHVPILDLQQNLAGIASPQRVTAFLQRFFKAD